MKKIGLFLLFTVLAFTVLICTVSAVSGTCGDNLTWNLDSAGTLTISGTGAMTDWSCSSDVPWDSYRSSIKKIVINSGVTSIGAAAFLSCYNLTSIEIPASVTSIDNYAFRDCYSLTDVYYSGTEAEWNDITIGSSNEPLTTATIHYNYKEEPEVIYGDITGDGYVSVSDVIKLLKLIATGLSGITDEQKTAADVNGDGTANVSDAIRILKHIANPDFPLIPNK